MPTFAELVENVDQLSYDEMQEMKKILQDRITQKKVKEILKASKQAIKESKEGKTFSAENPEQIIQYFNDLMNEKD